MIVAIIPAKKESRRLANKNMTEVSGKPLIYYTIKFVQDCSLIDKVYVSTDSSEIAEFAKLEGVDVIMRPDNLCGEVELLEVYRHAFLSLDNANISYIVGLQPDHPDRTIKLDRVIEYAVDKDLDDLISVDAEGNKNGSIRIIKALALSKREISVKPGAVMDSATNIHDLGDLKLAELRIRSKENPPAIKIKNKIISHASPAFVIAEGACNHICDMQIAKKMIDVAEASGADAIKFQTYKAEKLVAKDAKTYWNYGSTKSQYEYYKQLDKFDRKEYKDLFDYAKDKEIIVFSSPFDLESADMLNELGMSLFKIASCLISDTRLLRHIAAFGRPIILSVGGSELEEIREAVSAIYVQGNFSLVLLACTFSYPTKDFDAHMLRIKKLKEIFPDVVIGYSDHTEPDKNMVIPSVAVSLGAKVIEKHFTLDRTMTGSGHSFSVDPQDLVKMIQNIRLVEKVLGKDDLKLVDAEHKTRSSARMSIVADCNIAKGKIIEEDMLTARRPGTGIFPRFIDKIIGKKSKRDISVAEQLSWDDIE